MPDIFSDILLKFTAPSLQILCQNTRFKKDFATFKKRLTKASGFTIITLASQIDASPDEVWLSLARAPGLGPGGRRFESCHPDLEINTKYAGVVQW